jgi:hypothetical protein
VNLTLRFLGLHLSLWKEAFRKGKAYHKTVSSEQWAESGRQKAEGRRQKAEGRRQKEVEQKTIS